jgi:FkbM family methyltransferase
LRVAARILRAAPSFRGKERLGRLLAPAPPEVVELRMRDGSLMTIDLRSPTERSVYWTGEYEPGAVRLLAGALPSGSVVVDVGANIGFFTVALARVAGARVYAVEPMPGNVARLRRNVDANGLGGSVTVVAHALGDEPGELWLLPESAASETGNAAPAAPGVAGAVRVEVRRLDDVADESGIDRCDLLKIDVEGAELAVLRGGEAFVRRFRPSIYLELNGFWMERAGWTEEDLAALVKPWGYELRPRHGRASGVDDILLAPTLPAG